MNRVEKIELEELLKTSINKRVEEVSPNFRKKNILTEEQLEKIIQTLSINLSVSHEKALIGMILLFLQGATSEGAPMTMSIDLGEGKSIEKRSVINACSASTGHQYIRRIAETLAKEIGEFAYKNRLAGELAYRINNRLKAESGECLNEREMAFCSSFSQVLPNLSELGSERLTRLLAEDYHRRFDTKRKKDERNENQFSKNSFSRKKNVT